MRFLQLFALSLALLFLSCGSQTEIPVNMNLTGLSASVTDQVQYFVFVAQNVSETEGTIQLYPGCADVDGNGEQCRKKDCGFARDQGSFRLKLNRSDFPEGGQVSLFGCAVDQNGNEVAGGDAQNFTNDGTTTVDIMFAAGPCSNVPGLCP